MYSECCCLLTQRSMKLCAALKTDQSFGMIGKPFMLMESCDVDENCFQIIARSMPYFEKIFGCALKQVVSLTDLVGINVAHFIDRLNQESAA